ncbi:VanZ family protein [Metabacillus rhizolycopersici]|uniref:VanZ family protein n=1 Tax=Metabacillus rhizolycopersici TaxID=2875709 RepID=A0ABS7UMK1_9BACI|nr:VanZ family protein [Metabacillus rhizolycopersici]MBZ5749109.1 VanZ family protein [Metabacillus rhizolycopersici]
MYCFIIFLESYRIKEIFCMKKLLITILPFLYMVLIWILSSNPADALIETPFSFDDLMKESLHLIEFAILYWLIVFAFMAHNKWSERASLFAAIVAILYGLTDEIHQSFVPARSATLIDFIKDTIGVVVSYLIAKRRYFH